MKSLKNLSAVQPREHKPWAIWIWNLRIDREELEKQLRLIADAGFGGVAIRPGRDMSPSYMSAEFVELFGLVLEIAGERDLGVRIADDLAMPWCDVFDRITEQDPHARSRRLVLDRVEQVSSKDKFDLDEFDEETNLVLAVKLKKDELDLTQVKQVQSRKSSTPKTSSQGGLQWKPPAGEWKVLIFRKEYVRDTMGKFMPNLFNSKVADMYIKDYLEPLKTAFSKFIPSTFEGFVNEIPLNGPSDGAIPWDDGLEVKFRSKYKKELLQLLPALFLNIDAADAKNRPRLLNFIIQSMYDGFADPLEKWGRKSRFQQWLLCPEKNLLSSSNSVGWFSVVPEGTYAEVGFQNSEGTEVNRHAVRYVADSNVAEFRRSTVSVLGRNTECSGVSIQSMKAEIDEHGFAGPSTLLMDGFFFNLDHRRHVRTPFNSFWYSAEWNTVKLLTDYASRMQSVIRELQCSRDVAVLAPSISTLSEYRPTDAAAVERASENFDASVDALGQANLSYDLISEATLLSCSVRANGEFGTTDRIRKGNYRALVIPYARLISKGVFVFLERLAAKKGHVIFVDEPPTGSLDDGIVDAFTTRVEHLISSRKETVKIMSVDQLAEIRKQVSPSIKTNCQGKECGDVAVAGGSDNGSDAYLMRNISAFDEYFVSAELPAFKHIYNLDFFSGSVVELTDVDSGEGPTSVNLTFHPYQSYAFVGSNTRLNVPAASSTEKEHAINLYRRSPRNYRVVLRNQWEFNPVSLNALPLASWSTRIGLSRELGGYSHYNETYFEVKEIPSFCRLVFNEFPGVAGRVTGTDADWEVSINGTPIAGFQPFPMTMTTPEGEEKPAKAAAHLAHTISADIKDLLIKGYNRIAIRAVGTIGDPPAVLYPPLLVGEFPIERGSRGWAMATSVPTAANDSWVRYGFPYLSGVGEYKQVFEIPSEYERLVLTFSRVSGPINVAINGADLGMLHWQPMELDVTKACTAKRNELVVRVSNTVDNVIRMNGRPSGLTGDVFLDVY